VVAKYSSYVAQPEGTDWEQRCVDEFWSKHPEMYQRTLAEVARAPPAEQVAASVLLWIQMTLPDQRSTRLVVNTPGFDLCWLDHLLRDPSHLYIFCDGNGERVYTDVLELSSWLHGLRGNCDPNGSSSAAAAAVVTAHGAPVEPLAAFADSHDHDAANDAAATAQTAAYVMRALQSKQKHD
jgi:hypothetical protein